MQSVNVGRGGVCTSKF